MRIDVDSLAGRVGAGGLSIIAKNVYSRFLSGSDPCRKVLYESTDQNAAMETRFRDLLESSGP